MSSPFEPPKTSNDAPRGASTTLGGQVRDELVAARPYQLAVVFLMLGGLGLLLLLSVPMFNPCLAITAVMGLIPLWLLFDATRAVRSDASDASIAQAVAKQALFWRAAGWVSLGIAGLYVVGIVAVAALLGAGF